MSSGECLDCSRSPESGARFFAAVTGDRGTNGAPKASKSSAPLHEGRPAEDLSGRTAAVVYARRVRNRRGFGLTLACLLVAGCYGAPADSAPPEGRAAAAFIT